MKRFIRFDVKGTWMGRDHISTAGDGYYEEPGISCYRFDAEGVKNLIRYWREYCSNYRVEDYVDMQLTVFAGEYVGWGTDAEDCATCEETLAELDGAEFYKMFLNLENRWFNEEITEDGIYEELAKWIEEAIA